MPHLSPALAALISCAQPAPRGSAFSRRRSSCGMGRRVTVAANAGTCREVTPGRSVEHILSGAYRLNGRTTSQNLDSGAALDRTVTNYRGSTPRGPRPLRFPCSPVAVVEPARSGPVLVARLRQDRSAFPITSRLDAGAVAEAFGNQSGLKGGFRPSGSTPCRPCEARRAVTANTQDAGPITGGEMLGFPPSRE